LAFLRVPKDHIPINCNLGVSLLFDKPTILTPLLLLFEIFFSLHFTLGSLGRMLVLGAHPKNKNQKEFYQHTPLGSKITPKKMVNFFFKYLFGPYEIRVTSNKTE
jgi:hypothetical protein